MAHEAQRAAQAERSDLVSARLGAVSAENAERDRPSLSRPLVLGRSARTVDHRSPSARGKARRCVRADGRPSPTDRPRLVLSDLGSYFAPGAKTRSDHAEELRTGPEGKLPPSAERISKRYLHGYVPQYGSASLLPRLERWLRIPRWLLAVFVLCTPLAMALALIRGEPKDGGSGGEAIFLVGTALLILLGTTATSDSVLRYAIPEFPLLVCGGVLAIWELGRIRAPLAHPSRARAAVLRRRSDATRRSAGPGPSS